jgi:hypothetical protein
MLDFQITGLIFRPDGINWLDALNISSCFMGSICVWLKFPRQPSTTAQENPPLMRRHIYDLDCPYNSIMQD